MAAADNNKAPMAGETGFNTPLVVLAAVAVILFLYAMTFFLQGGYMTLMEQEKAIKVSNAPVSEEVTAAIAEQQTKLDAGYRWVDKDNGVAGMPIDAAKARLVEKLAAEAAGDNEQLPEDSQ